MIVAGALPVGFARDAALAFAARTGYPLLAEAGSQLRFAARPGLTCIDHFDIALALGPAPELVIQLGSEPVSAGWQAAFVDAQRWVISDREWLDPDARATAVVIGDVATTLAALPGRVVDREFADAWLAVERRCAASIEFASAKHPGNEGDVLRAALGAMPAGALLQLGNSLPVRVVDLVCTGGDRRVITQRGAAGIDGLVASAAGATAAGPVLLVLGDVSFAHDLGGLLATREATAPLAIVVIDNAGGRIFDGLPFGKTKNAAFERHWTTAPNVDPVAIATALGHRAVHATTPAAVATAVAAALATAGVSVIHAPVTPTGAQDLRATAIEYLRSTP